MRRNRAWVLFNCLITLGFLLPVLAECRPSGVVDTGCGPWNFSPTPMAPIPMDDATVFVFSQSLCDQSDPQVPELAPDVDIRSWFQWDRWGTNASDYNFPFIADCHAKGVLFIGGLTATILFADQFPPGEFDRIVTRDASGAPVHHDNVVAGAYRGSLANPDYRAYVERICKIQIDGGVDGLHFDEVDHGYDGATYDGNEGFDDYHLADFNSYLLAKYPAGTDFTNLFGMTPDNILKRDIPPGDLARNFNYRRYLAAHGWTANPLAPGNPLAAEWGRSYDDHPDPGCKTFVSSAEPYRYFGGMVRDLKKYASEKYGRRLLVTDNGIMPNVDFQSVGLWDWNHDGENGGMADYVPVVDGHLNGTVSLQSVFKRFRDRSRVLAPGAPVVLFLDWPTGSYTRYLNLPLSEKEDYWRLYAAEAYANGLFFAFSLKDTIGNPTATQQGMMPFFKRYLAFYRSHAGFYHHQSPSDATVTVSARNVMTAVWDQSQLHRTLVHLVNHNYDKGFRPQEKVTVRLPLVEKPDRVVEASPDLPGDRPLAFRYSDGTLTVTLPKLAAYSVLVVDSWPAGAPTFTPTATRTPFATPTPTPTVHYGPVTRVDDFEDQKLNGIAPVRANLWGGSWNAFVDSLGSGITVEYGVPGAAGTRYAVRVFGSVAEKGWSNYLAKLGPGSSSSFDLGGAGVEGLEFWFLGDGAAYRVAVPSQAVTDYDYYGAQITPPKGRWTFYQIPFVQMTRQGWGSQGGLPSRFAATDCTGIQFATQAPGPFAYKVDEVGFYTAAGLSPAAAMNASPP